MVFKLPLVRLIFGSVTFPDGSELKKHKDILLGSLWTIGGDFTAKFRIGINCIRNTNNSNLDFAYRQWVEYGSPA
ncbi:MAG: hypothetical protein DYG99_01695 [Bacteroidetes bacterium CHB5]|nr:hypothetical protein [Bacteroidetes bacterium CHB5]